ncbi:transmembrane emp24 domain-containing protein 5-like [Anticarsia gemmatalis]|uniref:transmembrane emp24 domain-containing protein 5-like n=1 Tax=Anticarsia gemmatalis TaxID=129554 RepID=UPI003F763DA9
MYYFLIIFLYFLHTKCVAEMVFESDVNFRVEAGSKTCIFQKGKVGQMMEVYYQVLDGQHGDLDISFDIIDPHAVKIVSDYKKSQNSIIMELEADGDYAFCMDNTYSMMNSKLVFVYVLIEDKEVKTDEAEVAVVDAEGGEQKEEEILEWGGVDENGELYYLEVAHIADSLSRTLKHVVKARHLLDIYGATKSRDSYLAFEDTFVVDVWSSFQISLMFVVGMLQVYMIKKLFKRPFDDYKSMY